MTQTTQKSFELTKSDPLYLALQKATGIHLKNDKLCLQFKVPSKNVPVKRSLGWPLSKENLQMAELKLANIKLDIQNHSFKNDEQSFWEKHFPTHSSNLSKIRLEECIDEYLSTQQNRISDSFASKLRTIKNWLKRESMLRKFISEITAAQIDDIRERKANQCRAVTVNDYTFTLNRIFKYALKKGYVKNNPLKDITPLEPDDNVDEDKYTVEPFSKDELKRLYNVIHIPQTKRIIKLAALTGLRHGELFALGWEDVDLENCVIHVRHSLTREGNIKPPKTAAGVRKVYLVPEAVKVLKKQKKKTFNKNPVLETIHFKNQKFKKEFKRRVFLSRGSKPYKRPEISSSPKQWKNWLIEAQVDHRPAYQLRHTYAATMLKNGAELNFLAKQMGHTDWSIITRIYGKVIKDDEEAHFETILGNIKSG
ncbi:tyrosine-type recombinase/integrase [Aliiglaciecola sp. NS0011-25]|uniref:tyrosine-type recombinase/integrase n=1 Tax=Aliiglaciecola sp. NS0011-25 TaxID=3127654 RepID=UPI0031087E74